MNYTLQESDFLTLSAGAIELGITPQRLSRLLKRLKVPVRRVGYTLLIPPNGIERVREAIRTKEIRAGRKKKGESEVSPKFASFPSMEIDHATFYPEERAK